ncbi:Putative glutamate carboxypeptidase [Arachis hypogaea]|uniref:Glutamate carboxypeptidase n=1 Tax=Arachis hypogaea TaxID=3818 RepID=A0A6B9VCI6_ARAHY|nr:Putative glutamate carboxypeptidase [Arachis hypogaea]
MVREPRPHNSNYDAQQRQGVDEFPRYVILGNHRDAWAFGAVDPNSGTAALLEGSMPWLLHSLMN